MESSKVKELDDLSFAQLNYRLISLQLNEEDFTPVYLKYKNVVFTIEKDSGGYYISLIE